MARTISVKVPVATLISDIESAIEKIDEAVKTYATDVAKYKADRIKYEELTVKAVIKALSNKDLFGTNYDSTVRVGSTYGNRIEVSVDKAILGLPDAPVQPSEPNQRESFGREYTTRKAVLERNLKILKMTSQEEVNASTYGSILELL